MDIVKRWRERNVIPTPEGLQVRPGQETVARILAKPEEKRKREEKLTLAVAKSQLQIANQIHGTRFSIEEIIYQEKN